jgi:uncharacterized Zn-finger protein
MFNEDQIFPEIDPSEYDIGLASSESMLFDFFASGFLPSPPPVEGGELSTQVDFTNAARGPRIKKDKIKKVRHGFYPCLHNGCSKIFTKERTLMSHVSSHQFTKHYHCSLCDSAFGRVGELKRHVQSVHTPAKGHECVSCKRTFSRSDALKRHTKTVCKPQAEMAEQVEPISPDSFDLHALF